MKKTILTAMAAVLLLTSCNNNKTTAPDTKADAATFTSDDTEKAGGYTVDGQSFKGKITLQTMAKGQYSVLCQQDEPFSILQIVFANEKEARADASLKASGGFYSMDPGDVYVSLSGDKEFTTKSGSTGTVSVSGNTITLKDVQLFDTEKNSKTASATLSF